MYILQFKSDPPACSPLMNLNQIQLRAQSDGSYEGEIPLKSEDIPPSKDCRIQACKARLCPPLGRYPRMGGDARHLLPILGTGPVFALRG